jgi:hypothetical protein
LDRQEIEHIDKEILVVNIAWLHVWLYPASKVLAVLVAFDLLANVIKVI